MLDFLKPIEEDLEFVERETYERLKNNVSLISNIGMHIAKSGGKRLRPALVLLSAKLCGYTGERSIDIACVVEFIHTATLLHDDVVDEADIRRGSPSANSKWGSEASILVGDYLFSKAFSLLVRSSDLIIMESLSGASIKMAEGEVLQLSKRHDINISKECYIDIITRKTAELISSCCEVGAIIAKAKTEEEEALASYGRNIGIAFQLVDDTLDFIAKREKLGKPLGNDLKEGKITMPLLKVVESESEENIEKIKKILSHSGLNGNGVVFILDLVKKHNGIEYALDMAADYSRKAKENLAIFPFSKEKGLLLELADYIVKRDH
ncbi:MAG: hypothetical protein A3C43_07635 [Candidatus Schekmanbacteria bacterium RIFCSPHIGHO2_02_FULL_38_11]|nr:MAG: hypothetical protein A3C43_07635 [Candidatus Schekmanbacteria bacterium RIFCSPHIGHO2_02_FULL_38_11]